MAKSSDLAIRQTESDDNQFEVEKLITEYSEVALADPFYIQLILITSHDTFEGSWTGLTRTERGTLGFRKIEWDTPLAVYQKLDQLYSSHTSIRDLSKKERREIIHGFQRAKTWVATVIYGDTPSGKTAKRDEHIRFGVRSQSYLICFPWLFLGTLLNLESTSKSSLTIVSAFSYASLKRAEESESYPIEQLKLAVFLDPLEDLPELRDVATHLPSGHNGIQIDRFFGTQVTAPRLLDRLSHADCVVYIGHGRQLREQETSAIICSYGKEIRNVDIERTEIPLRTTTRVAILMSCWSGSSAVEQSLDSWESQGLPYSLKRAGFDYIITSFWPVSPRIASSFIDYFLEDWFQGRVITVCVSRAYQRLIDKYGTETVMLEGSGIQLVA